MAFNEKTKLLAKKKSAYRCCICHHPFVEVHHITPQAQGGDDSLENAAPLCSSCHDLYGGNPDKRKIIRQMRDYWWEVMEERRKNLTSDVDLADDITIETGERFQELLKSKKVVLYHLVFQEDDFEVSVDYLHRSVLYAQKTFPNRRRVLYVDIEGHKNIEGGFDHDMFELQRHFLLAFLGPFLDRLTIPLGTFKNNKAQRNDIPANLKIVKELNQETINQAIDREYYGIWVSDKDKWLKIK